MTLSAWAASTEKHVMTMMMLRRIGPSIRHPWRQPKHVRPRAHWRNFSNERGNWRIYLFSAQNLKGFSAK